MISIPGLFLTISAGHPYMDNTAMNYYLCPIMKRLSNMLLNAFNRFRTFYNRK
jgi:hypothetical protein